MKSMNKSKHPNKQPMMLKTLVASVSALMTVSLANADVDKKMIGDLEIYQAPSSSPRAMMMLDTSGSMQIAPYCDYPSNPQATIKTYEFTETTDGVTNTFSVDATLNFCTYYDYGTRQYVRSFNRLSVLKDALMGMLTDSSFDSKTGIGIGTFSYQGDSKTGSIRYPIRPLTFNHRKDLTNYIATLQPRGGTPTANALAEAGAYMMGTTTQPQNDWYIVGVKSGSYHRPCIRYADSKTNYSLSFTDGTTAPDYYNCSAFSSYQDYNSNLPSGYKTYYGYNAIYYVAKPSYSGFDNSSIETKDPNDTNKYLTGAAGNQCAGNGVYLLTDGEPNGSSNGIATNLMNNSFADSGLQVNQCNLLNGNADQAWGCMANYAQLLNNAANPSKQSIMTATVGFGSDMKGLTEQFDANGNRTYDCNSSSNQNVNNLCKLGQDYGKGGYYYAETPEDIKVSFKSFVNKLQTEIDPVPSGTIVIPDNPFVAGDKLAVAYYPTLEADPANNSVVWRGNLKKYSLDSGTIWGKSDGQLFTDIAGNLSADVQDFWSTVDYKVKGKSANNSVEAGGVYEHLESPTNAMISNTRTVYLEDNGTLKRFGVNADGKVTLGNGLYSSTNRLIDPIYTKDAIHHVLEFLGFVGFDKTVAIEDLDLDGMASGTKLLGATYHSRPVVVSYSGELDSFGRVTGERDDYVLFGSSDGALHMVDGDDGGADNGGEEVFAFIPQTILSKQLKALAPGSTKATTGAPVAGIDAPWVVDTGYDFNFTNDSSGNFTGGTIDTSRVRAYGGLRMGGESLYGLNLTDRTSPSLMFSISPSTNGFARMGQIWAQPTITKIRTNSNGDGRKVLVFGGGYDTCYEHEDFAIGANISATLTDAKGNVCANKTAATGNAIYIVDAETGDLIWSASSSSGHNTTHADMKNSIVGEITPLDRNDDGFMDHLYYADLGGQIFRADFINAGPDANSFSGYRITTVLENEYEGTADAKYTRRFYERPIVSFYRNPNTNNLFALVNVISGDRSSPLSRLREDNQYADRVYGIIDNDIVRRDAEFYSKQLVADAANLTDADLLELPNGMAGDSYTQAGKQNIFDTLYRGGAQGWYYRLIRFDGYNDVKYTKGVGKSEVIGGMLYTTVYNPDKSYDGDTSCSAKVVGGSERQLYCLPAGVCMKEESKNGTAGYIPAGKGIQELTIGALNSDNTNIMTLITNQTFEQRAKVENRTDYGKDAGKSGSSVANEQGLTNNNQNGGDGSAPGYLYEQRFTMTPSTWYEK